MLHRKSAAHTHRKVTDKCGVYTGRNRIRRQHRRPEFAYLFASKPYCNRVHGTPTRLGKLVQYCIACIDHLHCPLWLLLLVSYQPSRAPDGDGEIEIRAIRPKSFTLKRYWVTVVCLVTIGLWCVEHQMEDTIGDMDIIAIIPIVGFFATGVLKKVWRVVS